MSGVATAAAKAIAASIERQYYPEGDAGPQPPEDLVDVADEVPMEQIPLAVAPHGGLDAAECAAYAEFRAAAQALKACNTAAVAASERFRAALARLSEAAAP